MPGQLKEVRSRISSVTSTQQITKAMKMVSAAKLRRAQDKITQMRPYSKKLSEMLQNMVSDESDVEIKLAQARTEEKILIVLITSDRGLCGGFNANLIKTARLLATEKYAKQSTSGNVEILCIGKKGFDTLKKSFRTNGNHVGLFSQINFDNVAHVAEELMNDFTSGKYDKIEIVYSQFKNAATQIVQVEQFLPLAAIKSDKVASTGDYIFEPSKEEIVETLIPKMLKTQLYKSIRDSFASEHGARMTAMHKATDNATDLRNQLKLTYNKARQAAITNEILEIVGGAEALKG